jgi:hypothetical protein
MQRALFLVHLFIDAFSIHLSCVSASISVFAKLWMFYYESAQKCEQILIHVSHILTYAHINLPSMASCFLKKKKMHGQKKGKKCHGWNSLYRFIIKTRLTFTCTQVLWFLARLTRPRASGVNTRPDPRFVIISTRSTQCLRGVQIPPFSRLVSHYTDTHLYVFSVALVLPHIIIRTENETKKLWFTGKSVKIKKWKYIRCQLVGESWGNKTREGVKRGGIRREQKKRGRGIKST